MLAADMPFFWVQLFWPFLYMAEQIPVTEAHQVSSRLITDAVPQQAGHQPGEGRNAGIPMGMLVRQSYEAFESSL